jgi:Meckel syndrome type 1 protein
MTNRPDNDDERELAALYRSLPRAEPDAKLDAAVLAEAARAATPVTRRMPRWPIAFATAATVVLAAGLAWHMRQKPPSAPMPASAPAPAPAPQADAEAEASRAPAPMPPQKIVRAKQISVPPPPHAVARRRAEVALMSAPAPAPSLAPAPAFPPAPPAPPVPSAPAEPPIPASPGVPDPAQAAVASDVVGGMRAADSPGRRVDDIRRRLREGDRDGAMRALAELRKDYPQYRLPDDLHKLGR